MFFSKIKRFLLARKTILSLVILILAFIVIAFYIPQRFSTPALELLRWQHAHPYAAPWIEWLGLDHVYSSPLFALLLFIFMVSLLLSSFEQFKIAFRKTFGGIDFEHKMQGSDVFESRVKVEELETSFRKQWYFMVSQQDGVKRFVKHPWGYWGNVLLHVGIVIAIGSSLVIVLTQQRGVIKLYEGEIFSQGSSWGIEDHGLLAKRLVLPAAVRLDSVTPEFWETDDLKQLTSELSFIGSNSQINKSAISINQILTFKGIRVYQQGFGNAFFLEFFAKGTKFNRSVFLIDQPAKRNEARYDEYILKQTPYTVKVKYFADADKDTLESRNPLLVLRLVDQDRVVGETTLKTGESGIIENYLIRLVKVSRWIELIFTVMPGMWGIYMSFFILVLGPALNYFTPPREFIIRTARGGTSVEWKGTRFDKLYRDEYERVATMYGLDRTRRNTS